MKKKQPEPQERCVGCGYTRLIPTMDVHVAPMYGEATPTLHKFVPAPLPRDTRRWRRDPLTGKRYRSGAITESHPPAR
jgi:hypothetical protein